MFGTRILTRFLLRRFFGGVGLVMMVVCGIILAVTFVERLPANPSAVAALYDAWIRLLEYVPLFLPPAVFMGTLVASYNLIKSSESVIISGAGMSPYLCARPFLVGAAAIGFFAAMVVNPYAVSLSASDTTLDRLQLVDGAIWVRDSSDDGYITLRARGMWPVNGDLVFAYSKIFIQDSNFKLTQRVTADVVILNEDGLHADNADIMSSDGITRKSQWHAPTRLNPQTVWDRYLQPNQISFWRLPEFINRMREIGVPVRGHLVQFWTLLFLPLTMIAMATLGVAFSQTRQRRNYSFGLKFGLGILTCFAVYFLVNMFNALGATGTLPPLLAIVAPPLIIIAGAGAFITSFDTI